MSIEEIEPKAAAVAVAPRVTAQAIEDAVGKVDYMRHDTLTICVVTMKNGFKVTGESAAASPENFNQALGEEIAFVRAKEKIWPLLGFALREKLSMGDSMKADNAERLGVMADRIDATLVGYKVMKNSVSIETHLDAFVSLIREARNVMADVVKLETGEDPWESNPLEG